MRLTLQPENFQIGSSRLQAAIDEHLLARNERPRIMDDVKQEKW